MHLRYSSALLPKSFERPGPKSMSPAMYCSGVKVVLRWRWIVDILGLLVAKTKRLTELQFEVVSTLRTDTLSPFRLISSEPDCAVERTTR
jgi:hypothetical protein